uniref:Nucleolar protein 16 n=1 Tax=Blastobotrys adeninivorans TaxID=409370 RepID=A0A060T525_BLAAD
MPSGIRRRALNKSSRSKNSRNLKKKQKKIRILSNPVIAEAWDPKLTLQQNYRKLGLTAKIARPAGGEEKEIGIEKPEKEVKKPKTKVGGLKEGKIVRDEDGNIRVEYSEDEEMDSDEEWHGFEDDDTPKTDVVKKLEEMAKTGYSKPHVQSDRETDWVEQLIQKHGDDYDAMFWDKKLNIYQQSRGDLKRRVYKWKKAHGLL